MNFGVSLVFCTRVTFGHMIYQHVQYIWMIPRIIWSSRWCVIKIQSCQVYVIGAVQFVFWNWPNVIPIVGVLKCMWEWHDDVECQNHGNISFLFPFLKSDWRFVTSNLCVQYSEMMRENSFTLRALNLLNWQDFRLALSIFPMSRPVYTGKTCPYKFLRTATDFEG